MGSDLQLTGLASGFDWKPVVEQLVELEAIPKQRLQSEKSANESKVSDLGLLKSQLDTLNGASKALSNEDLYDARKITLDSDSAAVLSASAAAGTLTGTYKVEAHVNTTASTIYDVWFSGSTAYHTGTIDISNFAANVLDQESKYVLSLVNNDYKYQSKQKVGFSLLRGKKETQRRTRSYNVCNMI